MKTTMKTFLLGLVALAALLTAPGIVPAASIPGVVVTGPIVPRDTADTYPTHHDTYGKGGYRSVANTTERDAIPVQRRSVGMLVGVVADGLIYQLEGDLTTWTVAMGGGGSTNLTYVANISALTNTPTTDGSPYWVLGYQTLGDWGEPKLFRWDATNTLAANAIRLAVSGVSTGRYVLDWDDRDVRVWGVNGDGTTSDSEAFQSALDYVEGEVNAGLSGGVIRVPDRMKILVSSTIRMRNGVSIIAASDRNADRGYPMDQTAPRFIAAPGLRAPIFEFSDYTNIVAANPRMIVLKGLVFDGNFDAQSTNDLALSAISIRSTLAKNISIEGCAFYDTPGWSIFAIDGFNAGNIRDCFLGNGIFTTVSADLKISDTDITGRTRGSLAAGTPYPPIWLGPYTQKNQWSDIMVYMGPRSEVGYDNSLRRWSISSADGSTNTLTLASTNGMFDGLPVVWRSGGALPSGVQTNQLYHVLWSGSATIQIATASGYRTRTALDFGAVSLSSDVLQMGEAAMLYASGGSSVSQNAFSNIRVEDSYGDLIHLDGAHDNAFSNPMLGFSYTNSGRFVRLTRGAQGNAFHGGVAAWNYPNQFGQQPDTIVEIDAESRANRFQGVRMSNASVQTVIDRNVTEPGNVWDYEEPSTMWMRGLDASFRFWDYNSSLTNSMWWNGNSVFWTLNESDPLNTYDWGFDGSNQILEIHGSTAPGLRIQGYNASSAPAITIRNKGGTRASPTQTPVSSTLGSLFFAGRDTSGDTSARAAITAVTPSTGWPSTTDTPAELWFAVTPDGTATRTNLFGIQGDLTSTDTPLMVSIGGASPTRVKRDSTSGALYTGTYSGGSGGTNGISDGNKGDISVSGGGTNWQVNAGTLTTNDLAAAAHSALRSPDFGTGVLVGASLLATPVALGAGTVLTNGTFYTASLSANRTVTFSGTPAEGHVIGLYVNATAVCTLTFPSSVDGAGGSTVTTKLLHVGRHELSWKYQNSEYVFAGTPVMDNTAATGAPTVNDDAGDGYSLTSRWYDTTNDKEYVCLDSTVGAAVWRLSTPLVGVDYPGLAVNNTFTGATNTFDGELVVNGDLIVDAISVTNAAATRTNLGLVIGVNVQAYDADLADLADGSLTGSKVGSGINGDNVTTGTVADARIASTIARDSEVAAAYEPLRTTVSQADAEAGTSTTVYAWTPQRVGQAIAALGGGGSTEEEGFGEWEWVDVPFIGADATSATYPFAQVAINGGASVYNNDSPPNMNGAYRFRSASGTTLYSGTRIGSVSYGLVLTNTSRFITRFQPTVTNDWIARLGFHDAISTNAPEDAVMLAITNNMIYGVCFESNVSNVTATGYTIPAPNVILEGRIYITNDFARFEIRTNGTTAWSDTLSGVLPWGSSTRQLFTLNSVISTGASTTNSATMMYLDRLRYGFLHPQ